MADAEASEPPAPPEGLDKLDYTIKYDVSLSDWTRIRLSLEVPLLSPLAA